MMPEWVRVLLTVAAAAWMIGWIIVIGCLAVKFTFQLMGEDDGTKKKPTEVWAYQQSARQKISYV